MSTERGSSDPLLPGQTTSGPEGPRSESTPPPRNIWRDGLWIGAVAFGIITIGAFYQTWLQLGPQGQQQRAQLKGNGVDVPSYGFDLSKLAAGVNPNEIHALPIHRNEVPVLKHPGHITIAQNAALTGYAKYVLPTDRVIGVLSGGYARAYPIQVMQVHLLANDALGNQKIVVAYDPLADTANAWVALKQGDTQLTTASEDPFLTFGVSGLEYKGLSLSYDYNGEGKDGASLWDLGAGQALTGPQVDSRLSPVESCGVMQWRDWLAAQPTTTIVQRDDTYKDEYKEDKYGPYYQQEKLSRPVVPQVEPATLQQLGLHNKSRGLGFTYHWEDNDADVFVPHEAVLANATYDKTGLGTWKWSLPWLDVPLTFHCRKADVGFTPSTVWVERDERISPSGEAGHWAVDLPCSLLFAWYASHPKTMLLDTAGKAWGSGLAVRDDPGVVPAH